MNNKSGSVLDQNKRPVISSATFSEDDEVFELAECEVETLHRASIERDLAFDPTRTIYRKSELKKYGMVREGYTRSELRERGIGPGALTCFDPLAEKAEELLPVETPFGSGIRKWQLPIDMMPIRVMKTIFPPNSVVKSHVHPMHSDESPGGGLRIIVAGSIIYKDKKYGPGDWFFAVNGEPYEFKTDPHKQTVVFYKYTFFAVEKGNRFSHPHASE